MVNGEGDGVASWFLGALCQVVPAAWPDGAALISTVEQTERTGELLVHFQHLFIGGTAIVKGEKGRHQGCQGEELVCPMLERAEVEGGAGAGVGALARRALADVVPPTGMR